MKKIDAGNSSFEKLISTGNLYVDKTSYFFDLIESGATYFFCSRPRRFGKTLALSTFEAIFKGKRELFKGLAIDALGYDWKVYPVIHIDLGKCQRDTKKGVEDWINSTVIEIALEYGMNLEKTDGYDINLSLLIEKASKDAPVVILIDEYDKILSSNIFNVEIEGMRDVIRGFFEIIKASYRNVRFVFITGVTRYAKVSAFSSMNNLEDISMDERYTNMFGYTQGELESNFAEYIDEGSKATGLDKAAYLSRLKNQYDGYRFVPEADPVYNPVSIGMFFLKGGKTFDNYWAETGNTKLIMDIAKKVQFDISRDVGEPISKSSISSFDIVQMASKDVSDSKYKALLFQSGYLTISSSSDDSQVLTLDFPNAEVRESFASSLLDVYAGDAAKDEFIPSLLFNAFATGNTEKAIDHLKSIYASIPYSISSDSNEHTWHYAFHCMLKAIGADLSSEVVSNKGRADCVLRAVDNIYLIELKRNSSAKVALGQIKKNGYADQFKTTSSKCSIHLLGINFDSKERNINDWVEEVLA